jgi:hypothetical protein
MMNLESNTITYKLVDRIEKISLAKFIDLVCDQKYSVLIIEGNPSEVDLLECWSNIYSQYLDILGDTETLYLITLQSEVERLNFKITSTEAAIKILRLLHVQSLVDILKSFSFDTRNLTAGHAGYEHALVRINSKLNPLKMRLDQKTQELRSYYKDQKNDTVSRSFFAKQTARLSKYQGYPIKPNKTMMDEYVAILKEYLSQFKPVEDGSEQKG